MTNYQFYNLIGKIIRLPFALALFIPLYLTAAFKTNWTKRDSRRAFWREINSFLW